MTPTVTISLEEYERLLEICKSKHIKNPLVNYYLSKDISNLRGINRISKKSEIRLLKNNIELENNNNKLREKIRKMKTNDLNFCGGLFKLLSKDWNVFTFNKRRKELLELCGL